MAWNIIGHDSAVALLKQHVNPAKTRQSYLITGPQGVGKRTLALAFIKALCCPSAITSAEPCNQCVVCQQIDRQEFSDLSVLAPEEGHKDIRIEQIRTLQHSIVLAPYQAPYRIALILNFEYATPAASNALLKTLEEPSSKAIIILTADSQESLLPTIVSRCEVLRLRPLSVSQAEAALIAQKGIFHERANLFAHLTSGRIGAAIQLNDDPKILAQREKVFSDLQNLLSASRRVRFGILDSYLKRSRVIREDLGELIHIWLSFWRDVFIQISGANIPLVNIDQQELIRMVSNQTDLNTVQNILISLEEGLKNLDVYVNARLLGENLLLQWPKIRN